MDRRARFLALIGVASFLLVALLSGTRSLPVLDAEWTFYDWHLRAAQPSRPLTLAETPITIVGMEEETPLVLWNEKLIADPVYPLPRSSYEQLVEQCIKAGAKVIAFDLFFSEERAGDTAFLSALGLHGNALAAVRPASGDTRETFIPICLSLAPGLYGASVDVPRSAGRSVRFVRSVVQEESRRDQWVPHFGLALAAAYHDELRQRPVLEAGELRWGSVRLPTFTGAGDPSHTLIRYLGGGERFPYVRYEDVLTGAVPAEQLKGRILLVGRYSPIEDRHMTPVGEMQGVALLANIGQMACTGKGIQTTEAASLWVGLALTGLFLILVWRFTLLPALLTSAVLALVWIGVAHAVFLRYTVWWETVPPLAVLLLSMLLTIPYEILRARRAFETMLSTSAARSAVSGRGMELGTREVFVTVVFCDIRGFTPFCEEHSPEEVESLLRAYCESGDTTARRFGSELDKFMGDAIMLYFFEQPGQESGATRAVRWAGAMLEQAEELGIRIGVGIASGLAREGFIGAPGRMQRTVIGTVVNLASRLQEATKTVGTPVLLSEGSFSQLSPAITAEPLGEITVRGKQTPVAVYRPVLEQETP